MKDNYIVYKHTNKENNKIYIGITSQPFNNRCRRNGIGYRECPFFYNAIQKYGWNNFEHIILYENLTKEKAEQKEIELIAQYKSNQKEFGYNIQNGGNSIGKMNDITKKKISKTLKGKNFTEEHKRKIGESQLGNKNHMFGKNLSDEVKEKIRIGNLKHPSSGCFTSHKINQYDLQGNFIKTWNTMGEIKRELGISHSMISDCCRGLQKTSGGFIWKYCQ